MQPITPPESNVQEQVAELERTIERLRNQLSQSQRLATIGELTSTTTHEFNNLLMTIMNYAKLGLRHKDEPTRDKALGKIMDASNRAAKVTQTILGLARNRTGEAEPTSLETIIRDTLVLLERELHRYRILVETDFDPVPMALVEGNQIQRVLINLLTNARQAIGESGVIKIRLSFDSLTECVVLMVRDSGKGIAPENMPRIFDSFFSTKNGPDASGKGGTGLGLSACREIIEEHRGKIRVESTLGKGTAFYIRLPAVPKSQERAIA